MKEEWRAVPGYFGYFEVSSLGRLRSTDRVIIRNNGRRCTRKGKMLNDGLSDTGYIMNMLRLNGVGKQVPRHQLVAMAFLGYERNGKTDYVVDHIDENKLNNRLDNLQIVTNRQNVSKSRELKGDGTSKHIGVCWVNRDSRWLAQIRINGKRKYLGHYKTEEEASDAYQKALKSLI